MSCRSCGRGTAMTKRSPSRLTLAVPGPMPGAMSADGLNSTCGLPNLGVGAAGHLYHHDGAIGPQVIKLLAVASPEHHAVAALIGDLPRTGRGAAPAVTAGSKGST